MSDGTPPPDPLTDLDAYVALPRVGGLWLSPDGRRLVVGVATPDPRGTRYVTALWEVDPEGRRPARRLTRSARGETGAAFTPGGDLLFVSARQVPEVEGGDAEETASLWLQPAGGGDARVVAAMPGGVRGVVVARDAGTVAAGSAMMPSATDAESDREIRKRRKDGKVSAILHEQFPIRFWDHDLGPDRTRLLVAESGDLGSGDARLDLRDLTGHAGRGLHDEATWDITPDGRTLVADWSVAEAGGSERSVVVAIDVASGDRRVLAGDPDHDYEAPRLSPDGTRAAVLVARRSTPQDAGDHWLGIVPLAGGEVGALTAGWDRWPASACWTPDGAALVVVADDHGRSPLWRVDTATGEPTRLTGDGAFTDVEVSPDGRWVYALRSTMDSPPVPVRVALDGGSPVEVLPGPAEALGVSPEVPGWLEEVTATATDGTPLRAWLALPHGAAADAPAPLWIHGGPLASFAAWSWRWNPWLAVARGYAVLLPDPALSTGYGIDFVRRGWGTWGGAPYTDLMSITDAAEARADIDAGRTAAMGGSFGGYMANWVAGHTDRFAAIVTHAAPWALDQFGATTDAPYLLGAPDDRRDGRGQLTAPLRRRHRHPDAGRPRHPGLPGAGRRGAAAVVGPRRTVHGRGRLDPAPVPPLRRGEPLGPVAEPREGLVLDGVRLPRPPRAR